jgi:DNA-binding response OmpR family regulator
VLVIEDDEAIGEVLAMLLGEDSTVLRAVDAPSGLQLAQERKPDLILLDPGLPGQSGFEVLGALKELDATRDIPVLMVSGAAPPSPSDGGSEPDGFIAKPFDIDDVLAQVEALTPAPGTDEGQYARS